MLPEDLAVPGVRPRLGDKLYLDSALPGAVGAEIRGRNSDLLHGLQPWRDEGEETGAAALEALRVIRDAVKRDIDGGAGQAVEGAIPRGNPLLGAGRQQRKGQRNAAGQRQILQ